MNKILNNYNHLIWDWNGTLFDDVKLCSDIMNMLLTQESLPNISVKKYKSIFTFPVIEYYKIAGHTFKTNSFEVIGKQFMDEYEIRKGSCKLYQGATELLEILQSEKMNQYLLSAYEQNNLNHILDIYGIKNYFKYVVGLDNIYAGGKSHLARNLELKIRSNGQAGNILLIGDTIHDYEVAREINSDCIMLSHGHQDKERLLKLGIPVVKNFEELKNLFREL